MHRKIESYAIFYNVEANEGQIIFHLAKDSNGQGTATLLLDTPEEGRLILDMLRNEAPVYYDEEHQLLVTGVDLKETVRRKTTRSRKTTTKRKTKK